MKARPAPLPQLRSDSEAEAFVDMADLTEYDLSDFRPVRFEIKPKETSLNTLHSKPNRATRADRIKTSIIAKTRRVQHDLRIIDTTHRPEREQVFVFQPNRFATRFQTIKMLAANGAGCAGCSSSLSRNRQLFGRNLYRSGKTSLLKIACRQHIQTVKRQ